MSYWRGSEFIVQNYATGVFVAAHPLICDILDFFDDWQSIEVFLTARPPAIHNTLRSLLDRLRRHTLLQASGDARSAKERAMDSWQPWNPAAGFFHLATKDVPFIDMDAQVRRLRERSRTSPMPHPVKRCRSDQTIQLPRTTASGEFSRVLLSRRTWRRFGRKSVDLASFSTLLDLTGGIQRWAHAAGEGKVALKTSPSGGARHSIELYVLALRITGVRPGLYHYAADTHGLELIDAQVGRRLVARYLPRQPWFKPAAALVFFAPVFARELWRYRYARAYRALLIEAGHLCQTFCLTATWLGLAPFCTMALADSRIENDLGLDGITESVLYVGGIGTRPPGTEPPRPQTKAGRAVILRRGEVRKFPGRIVAAS